MSMLPNPRSLAGETIQERFFDAVARFYDRPLFIADGGKGKTYTFGQVGDIVTLLSNGLLQQNLVTRSEIGILAENRPEYGISYLSILKAGGTVVPIDANLHEKELAYVIGHAHLQVIFTSNKFAATIRSIAPDIKLISFDEGDDNWQNILSDKPPAVTPYMNEIAALIYTSGTTGAPKAVELTHKNILANYDGIAEAIPFGCEDIMLSILPLHHTFEATCGLITPMLSGASIVYARSLKSRDILDDIGYNKVTIMIGVPLLFEKMYHAIIRGINAAPPAKRALLSIFKGVAKVTWPLGVRAGKNLFKHLREKAGLNSIRMFVSGGAAIPPHIAAFYNYIGFDFFQGYGMTECSPVIAANRQDNIVFGAVGPPLENVEVRIDAPDENGVGEICVRGDSVTPGYRDNPEQTAKLIRDGWLYTGDLGRIIDGRLWITGRRKNLIVSAAGKNIYPEELEEKLLESDRILEVVVVGKKKANKQGEEVFALIVPDIELLAQQNDIDLNQPDMDKIKKIIADEVKQVNERVADYKRIASFDVHLEELEKTSTKKIKRFRYTEK